jgi:hypothetical protein
LYELAAERLRVRCNDYLGYAEVAIYAALAVLLFLAAVATVAGSARLLWNAIAHWNLGMNALRVLDDLLVVLMVVEILHTVRISIRSHILVTEPFLIVGLIASIRRILVITLEASSLTQQARWSPEGESLFRASMVELGLLGLLVMILVVAITLLRRYVPAQTESEVEEYSLQGI